MWWVCLTARSPATGRVSEKVIRIPGDTSHDLLYNGEIKWAYVEKMLERGTLTRVEVDFKSDNGWGNGK